MQTRASAVNVHKKHSPTLMTSPETNAMPKRKAMRKALMRAMVKGPLQWPASAATPPGLAVDQGMVSGRLKEYKVKDEGKEGTLT